VTKGHLRNIKLNLFRKFLQNKGCICIRTKGGHEIWKNPMGKRPIVLQSHEDPIPEFIIKNNLRNLNLTKDDFLEWLQG
jgi:predicted RNA binding protein YcfA (HicA-like mRNA interferase family)